MYDALRALAAKEKRIGSLESQLATKNSMLVDAKIIAYSIQ